MTRHAIAILFFLPLIALAGDRSPAPLIQRPAGIAHDLFPERQIEGFTCGMHAMNTIYRSYGLDPVEFRIRARLGVDVPTLPLGTDNRGSVHPDVLRILHQDGFAAEVITLKTAEEKAQLAQHLNTGHSAMTLIKRKENGHLHWIVLTALTSGELTIADSLRPTELYTEPYTPFAANNIISVILVQPQSGTRVSSTSLIQHGRGIWGMLRATAKRPTLLVLFGATLLLHAGLLQLTARIFRQRMPYFRALTALALAIPLGLLSCILIDQLLGYAPIISSIVVLLLPIPLVIKIGKIPLRPATIAYLLSLAALALVAIPAAQIFF